MFLFEPIPWYSALMWLAVLGGLILLNGIVRLNRWFSIALFLIVPLLLAFTVWPDTIRPGSSVDTWFHRTILIISIAACLGFLAIRFVEHASEKSILLLFPPAILAAGILAACIREFQCYVQNGFGPESSSICGPWNILTGIAGLLNIIAISGWFGISISRDSKRDLLWPDMLRYWIVAFSIWNFSYIYNSIPDHAFYAGAAVIISCALAVFFFRKGTWLQNMVQALAVWMMFIMSFPAFIESSIFAVKSSQSTIAMLTVSSLALAANAAVFAYHLYRILYYRINPLLEEVYAGLPEYNGIKYEFSESTDNKFYSFGYYGAGSYFKKG